MRLAVLISLMLTGCVVQKAELNRPYAAARFDSDKTAAQFAACSAEAMNLQVREDEGILTIVRTNNLGVQVARWDFLPTNSGSQAELRTGANDDAGMELVRGCT
ncbi:hypothetical protein NCF86_00175 [Pelagerythrobacter marinus]|nr:hypothetical protein NCF86_00175 [Pelagerythrobacter marinus]